MMMNKYPLEWLDSLILLRFNPKRTDIEALSEIDLENISAIILKETNRVQVRIKNEIFSLRKKRQIRLLVRKYHSTLIFLLDTIIENQKCKEFQTKKLSKTTELIIRSLDELLFFLENRFANFLSLDERVPITYLIVSRKELQLNLKKLIGMKTNSKDDEISVKIVHEELSKSISMVKSRDKVTFRQIFYERELLKNITEFSASEGDFIIFSHLDEVLISLNFNSPLYLNSLVNRFLSRINNEDLLIQKVQTLALYYKEYSQLYCNEKITFDASRQNIKNVLDNWFKHEIDYLEKQIELPSVNSQNEIVKNQKPENKLECDLSADQIGIILRAADEARVVKSRSMSLVFQTIIPYLSTSFKKELSYQSVRSKSYNAEENDKNAAIMTLEKMIKKIKSY